MVLFALCALVPVATSAFFDYRAGERVAISIGAISSLVLLMSWGFVAWHAHVPELSGEDKRLPLFLLIIPGTPALCIFLGTLAGYIAMRFLGSEQENN